MRHIYLMLILVGCSGASPALTFPDGGDAADPSDGPPVADAATDAPVDPDSGDADAGPADSGSGDGYDGYTLPSYRRVFLTSKTFGPNFGGLAVADKACADAAAGAGLGGNWAAWLSTKATSAASRLEHAAVPYKLLDGTEIAANWSSLTTGPLSAPIGLDENGKAVPIAYYTSGFAWTGTAADGSTSTTYTDSTCSDWTYASGSDDAAHEGACGIDNQTGADWTDYVSYCEAAATLSFICMEQP
jgi:hypothetical protein